MPSKWDDRCRRQIAYIIATVGWETNLSFQPVQEAYYITPESKRKSALIKYYTTGPGRNSRATIVKEINGKTVLYTGRGYVQLTHDYQYQEFSQMLFGDDRMYSDPDIALEPDVAMDILIAWFYKKHRAKLERYTGEGYWDLKKLRGIVNGTDKWDLIGAQAKKNYNALNWEDKISIFEPVSLYERLKLSLNTLYNLNKLYL